MEFDDGIFVVPLPEDDKDQGHGGDDGQSQDKVRLEPVFALSFVEDHLQGSEAERDQAESDVVDFGFTQLAALEIGRILNKSLRQQEGKNANRDIDEENPAPAEVVGDPASERG